jgi:HEPN domain-containing protein
VSINRRRVEAFLVIASEELEAARRLNAALPRRAEYFLQQAVEKLLRAILQIELIPAGVGHGLVDLAHRLPEGHMWRERFKGFDHLSAASTMYRYPTAGGRIANVSAQLVTEELGRVESLDGEVREFCAARLKSGL